MVFCSHPNFPPLKPKSRLFGQNCPINSKTKINYSSLNPANKIGFEPCNEGNQNFSFSIYTNLSILTQCLNSERVIL